MTATGRHHGVSLRAQRQSDRADRDAQRLGDRVVNRAESSMPAGPSTLFLGSRWPAGPGRSSHRAGSTPRDHGVGCVLGHVLGDPSGRSCVHARRSIRLMPGCGAGPGDHDDVGAGRSPRSLRRWRRWWRRQPWSRALDRRDWLMSSARPSLTLDDVGEHDGVEHVDSARRCAVVDPLETGAYDGDLLAHALISQSVFRTYQSVNGAFPEGPFTSRQPTGSPKVK